MGSGLDKYNEYLDEKRHRNQREELSQIAAEISGIKPDSEAYRDFIFMWRNRSKIAKNQRLIEILG